MPSHMALFHHIWPPSIIIYGPVKIKSKSKGVGRDAITYGPLPLHMAPSIIIYGPVKIKSKSKGNGRDAITYGPLPSHMAPFNHHIWPCENKIQI